MKQLRFSTNKTRFITKMIRNRVIIATEQELVCSLSSDATSNDHEWYPKPYFKVAPLLDAEYFRNGTKWNTDRDLHNALQLKGVFSNDLE